MSNGWIKLHRQLQDHWIWRKPEQLKAWIDILLMVTHTERTKFIKGQEVLLKQGEVDASFRYLAKRWDWSIGKVQRFLILLKKCSMIEVKTSTGQNLISVCNYASYQIEQNQNDTQVGTAPIQERYENKNVKKERNNIYSLEFDEIWKLYPVKKNKHISFLKYKRALKDKTHSDLKTILQKHINSWVGKEKEYLPHLSTWLNQKRYLDELVADDDKVFNKPKSFIYECYICGDEKTLSREIDASERYHKGCGGDYEVRGSVLLTNLKAKHNKPKKQDGAERIKKEEQLKQKSQLSDIAMELVGEFKA